MCWNQNIFVYSATSTYSNSAKLSDKACFIFSVAIMVQIHFFNIAKFRFHLSSNKTHLNTTETN